MAGYNLTGIHFSLPCFLLQNSIVFPGVFLSACALGACSVCAQITLVVTSLCLRGYRWAQSQLSRRSNKYLQTLHLACRTATSSISLRGRSRGTPRQKKRELYHPLWIPIVVQQEGLQIVFWPGRRAHSTEKWIRFHMLSIGSLWDAESPIAVRSNMCSLSFFLSILPPPVSIRESKCKLLSALVSLDWPRLSRSDFCFSAFQSVYEPISGEAGHLLVVKRRSLQ